MAGGSGVAVPVTEAAGRRLRVEDEQNVSVGFADASPNRGGKNSSTQLGSPIRGAGAKRLRGSGFFLTFPVL